MLCFFAAAKSATEPAVDDDRWMYEGAKVSQHVASQTRDLPLAQGMMVSPSGRFTYIYYIYIHTNALRDRAP